MASALLVGDEDCLEVSEQGLLAIPQGVQPKGFHLVVAVKKNSRTFVVQKNVGTEGGDYNSLALSSVAAFAQGYEATVMRDPIDVLRAGENVWTGWHKNAASNRVDCWHLGKDGELWLFQVGIFTHDNGKSFYLHGEFRWAGQLYQMNGTLVGLPESKKYGSLEGGTSKRTQIFTHPAFILLLDDIKALPTWDGDEDEVNPPLPRVTPGQLAVDWFIQFAGQTGQGIAKDHNGKPVWIHGLDVEGFNPNSTEPLLWHGDVVSAENVVAWGHKAGGPPKALGVRMVCYAH
jgi:hypothetical protein